MTGILIAVASGIAIGWKLHKRFEHESLNRRFRKSVQIAAHSYKRSQNNRRPRKAYTAGDDYA